MVKANELRIGNWIQSSGGGSWQVKEILDDGLNVGYRKMLSYPEFDGIPLSLSVMSSLGFQISENRETLFLQVGNLLYLSCDYPHFELFHLTPETWRDISISIWNDIKYVHQLQNLCFALTGKEINLYL